MDLSSIKNRLEAQCSKREYCTSDIMQKAQKAIQEKAAKTGESVDARKEAEAITASLLKDGFLSDLRYASAFARDKSSLTGWGPVKIRFALRAKKIPDSIIDEALGETDSGKSEEKLGKLVQAKYKVLKDDPQVRLKLLKYILGRGYEYDEASDAIERVLKG